MPAKPHRLINYEKEYAKTGVAPEESSYRNHELRNRVQEKSNRIDDRLKDLREDVTSIDICTEVSIGTNRSARGLGELFGVVASKLLTGQIESDPQEEDSEFLLGVLRGIDRVQTHDSTTVEHSTEYVENLLNHLSEKRKNDIRQQAKAADEWFQEYHMQKPKQEKSAKESIRKILEQNNLPDSDFVVNRIYHRVDNMETITENAVLNNAYGLSLVERNNLREKIDKDISKLHIKRKGVLPKNVLEYIVTEENQPVHTSNIVQSVEGKGRSVVVTILRDLAGVENRRKRGHDQVHSTDPILEEVEEQKWTTTAYGEVISDWLFGQKIGLSNTPIEEEVEVAEQLEESLEPPNNSSEKNSQ